MYKMKMCRACLNTADGEGARFLDESHEDSKVQYAVMLEQCAGVRDDERAATAGSLPRALCDACCSRLPAAWAFVLMCRASDARLRSAASAPTLELQVKEEPPRECDLASDSEDELLSKVAHQRRRRPSPASVTCSACGHRAPTECRYKKHVRSEHPERAHELITYPCIVDSCSKVFKRKSDLHVHSRVHSGEKPFACERCPRRFAQSGTLIEHRRHHTGETPFRCELCRRAFSSRSSFWRHRRVHTRERPFSCEQCGKAFAHASTLRTHALVHSEVRAHVCRECGKASKSVYALRQHAASVHRTDKQFVCERCGKRFAVKANLELHARNMHGRRAGRCTVCARDSSDLSRHMLRHADAPLFRCDLCSRAFRLKSALVFHLGFHKDATKYACAVEGCDKAFPKLNMLEFHTRKLHSNETPHVCRHCRKGFFRASDLTRHTNTAHPASALL